jgi:hypothetical protein
LGISGGNYLTDPQLVLKIIHWFKDEQHCVVIGGVSTEWGTLSGSSTHDPAWKSVYAALDVVQPWTPGRYKTPEEADAWKASRLVPDMALTAQNGQLYMPVIFPGFSWHNLMHDSPENRIPRAGGKFLWEQAVNARTAGAPFVKIAMFDEVNEGTAIFKAASRRSDAPTPGYWLTLDADGYTLPTDWYLQVTREISHMFHGKLNPPYSFPLKLPVQRP